MRWPVLLATVFALTVMSPVASAASGYASGSLKFWQKNGYYCPSFSDCTGAHYLQSDYDKATGIRSVWLYMAAANGDYMGQGVTDANGNFLIYWYLPYVPPYAYIVFTPIHNEWRFGVFDPTISLNYYSWPFYVIDGQTVQGLAWTWGSSATPDPYLNLYDAAARDWDYAISRSSLMVDRFGGVSLVINGIGPSFDGPSLTVNIPSTAVAFEGGTTAHELGHAVVWLSDTDDHPFANYCHPLPPQEPCNNAAWQSDSQEWKSVAWSEGMASFFGAVAGYGPEAVQPAWPCDSVSYCTSPPGGGYDLEYTVGAANCTAADSRKPINYARAFWDIFDFHSDYATDTFAARYSRFPLTIELYPPGTETNQAQEVYDPTYSYIAQPDGHSGASWRVRMQQQWGVDVTPAMSANCVAN